MVGNRDAGRANTLLRSTFSHYCVPSRYAASRFLVCHTKSNSLPCTTERVRVCGRAILRAPPAEKCGQVYRPIVNTSLKLALTRKNAHCPAFVYPHDEIPPLLKVDHSGARACIFVAARTRRIPTGDRTDRPVETVDFLVVKK